MCQFWKHSTSDGSVGKALANEPDEFDSVLQAYTVEESISTNCPLTSTCSCIQHTKQEIYFFGQCGACL